MLLPYHIRLYIAMHNLAPSCTALNLPLKNISKINSKIYNQPEQEIAVNNYNGMNINYVEIFLMERLAFYNKPWF